MLTVEQCRTYLKDTAMTDDQVVQLRDAIYAIAQSTLAPYFATPDDDDH